MNFYGELIQYIYENTPALQTVGRRTSIDEMFLWQTDKGLFIVGILEATPLRNGDAYSDFYFILCSVKPRRMILWESDEYKELTDKLPSLEGLTHKNADNENIRRFISLKKRLFHLACEAEGKLTEEYYETLREMRRLDDPSFKKLYDFFINE